MSGSLSDSWYQADSSGKTITLEDWQELNQIVNEKVAASLGGRQIETDNMDPEPVHTYKTLGIL